MKTTNCKSSKLFAVSLKNCQHVKMSTFSLLTVIILSLPLSFTTKSCLFCADSVEKCQENQKVFAPDKMYCQTFIIMRNYEEFTYFEAFREPKIARNLIERKHLFITPLANFEVQKTCIKVDYQYSEKNKTLKVPEMFRFQSCSHGSMIGENNTCSLFRKKVSPIFKVLDCKECNITDCNSSSLCKPYLLFPFILFHWYRLKN